MDVTANEHNSLLYTTVDGRYRYKTLQQIDTTADGSYHYRT